MTTSNLELRAAAYISKMPPAIAGNGGHRATFAVACRLVEFGLSFDRALPLMLAWNQTHCQPRWTEADLNHKLVDAFKRTSTKSGYVTRQAVTGRAGPPAASPPMRASNSTMQSPSPHAKHGSNRILERHFSGKSVIAAAQAGFTRQNESVQLATMIKALLKKNGRRPEVAPKATIAAGLEAISECVDLSREESNINSLAQMRGLRPITVRTAYWNGLVRFENYKWKPAWFILDRSFRVASARRMDGCLWFEGTSNQCKALMLPGSQAKWPIGIREAQKHSKILLVEGAPDLLAAFQLALGRNGEFAPVAMLSAACPIHTDALRLFTGKRVRIYAHNDGGTGQCAAQKWASQICHRATVDIFPLAPYGIKDLNDLVRSNINPKDILP